MVEQTAFIDPEDSERSSMLMLSGLLTTFATGANIEELSVTLPSTAEPSHIHHQQRIVAPPFTLPPAFMVKRGVPLTPDAGVMLNEICTVSRWRAPSAAPARDFTPDRSSSGERNDCAALRAALPAWRAGKGPLPKQRLRTAGCVAAHGSAVFPCAGGWVDVTANKYCSGPKPAELLNQTETRWMSDCARVSAPILLPQFEEWFVHPDNINHVGRDLLGLASMLSLGRRSGYTVMLKPEFVNSSMSPWGKNILQALTRRGLQFGNWHDEADRFAKVAVRLGASSPVGRDVDLSCGVVCATTSVRYGNTGDVEGATLLRQAALEHCQLPPDPPTDRTLLLITREPPQSRTLRNLPLIVQTLTPFAKSLGLRFAAANFGKLSFCEQVQRASAAYIMVGIHGADLINTMFQHADSTLFELYGRGVNNTSYGNLTGPEFLAQEGAGTTAYLQQLAGAGRRGLAVKLFNVSGCSGGNWMYDSKCEVRLDVQALVALIREWVPPPSPRSTQSKLRAVSKQTSPTPKAWWTRLKAWGNQLNAWGT